MSSSFVTPWTVAHKGPLSMGFLGQKYWSGLPFPTPGDILDPGIELEYPALAGGFFTKPSGKQMIISYMLKGNVGNIEEQMGNISRDTEFLRKNPKEVLEDKTLTVTMKNALDGLIGRLDVTKERISELEDRTIKTSQDEM